MNNDIVYEEKIGELTIEIFADEPSESPFKDWDCLPDIIGWHRGYDFNTRKEDKHLDPEAFLAEAKTNKYVVLPLYMHEHGGLVFDTKPFSCGFDSGQFGFIFWTREKLIDNGMKKTKAKKALEDSVETLTDYANGYCFGFRVRAVDGEVMDSCGGYYGDFRTSGCLEEARAAA